MAAVIYDLTPERILERLEQFRANFGTWPTVRDVSGQGRWRIAELAGRLHDMERQGLVVCDPGRVYRPRGTAPNPPKIMEVTKPVQNETPEPAPVQRYRGRPRGCKNLHFPPHAELLAEIEAMRDTEADPVAAIAARYGAARHTTKDRLLAAHVAINGRDGPRAFWSKPGSRRRRPLVIADLPDAPEPPPLQDAQGARVAADDAPEEGGQGGSIPEVVTEAQRGEDWIDFTPTTATVRVKVSRANEPAIKEAHEPTREDLEVLFSQPDPAFDPSKIDFAGMTETAPEAERWTAGHTSEDAPPKDEQKEDHNGMAPMKPHSELPRPRPWTSSTVVPLPLLLRLLLEEIEDDQVLRRVLKRLAGEVA